MANLPQFSHEIMGETLAWLLAAAPISTPFPTTYGSSSFLTNSPEIRVLLLYQIISVALTLHTRKIVK